MANELRREEAEGRAALAEAAAAAAAMAREHSLERSQGEARREIAAVKVRVIGPRWVGLVLLFWPTFAWE